MEIEPGTVVANRYRISRAIGRGGMGEVFAAENIRTGRPVAVKLLRADSKSKSSAVERFRREARAAGSINSDHVTQVLDVEDDSEHGIVIVFELLEGESLIDRLKRTGPIPFDELHPIIEEVWVGLSDAHKVGIIHRDLKPSNVFLERRPDGHQRVKILDFGISKLPKEMGGETLTEMGQSLGTFSFMPPEQIGRAKTVDHRADIYATTTMIYQSLTGQLPYVARNILVMVELKSKTNPRPLSEALGHPVDQALEQFVATGLARNPADRFQSALDALERWRALKSLQVPESRRALSMQDLNAQARAASAPLPAAGRPASSGPYLPPPEAARPQPQRTPTGPQRAPASGYAQTPTGIGPVASSASGPYARPTSGALSPTSTSMPQTGMGPPALVVPTLEPVMPAALPRLYDQTESTTDGVSHIELVHPKAPVSNEGSGIAQRGQELRRSPEPEGERKGPQGTRVLPPTVVQQAVAAAEARKASQGDLRGASAQAQAQPQSQPQPASQGIASQPHPHSQPHSGQPASSHAPSQGAQGLQPPPPRRPTPSGMPAVSPSAANAQSARSTGAPRPASSHPPPLPQSPASAVQASSGSHAVASGQGAGSSAPPTATAQSVPSPDPRLASQVPQSPRPHLGQAPTPFPVYDGAARGSSPSAPGPSYDGGGARASAPSSPAAPPSGAPLAQVPTPFPGLPAVQAQPPYASAAQTPTSGPSGAQLPLGAQLPPGFRENRPVQLSTLKLPDESSSIPGSQDKTTVYRPKQKKPQKKQSVAVFVIGALAFAVVGFGIVFLVQYLVKTLGH